MTEKEGNGLWLGLSKKQIFTNIRQYVHLTFNSIRIDFL